VTQGNLSADAMGVAGASWDPGETSPGRMILLLLGAACTAAAIFQLLGSLLKNGPAREFTTLPRVRQIEVQRHIVHLLQALLSAGTLAACLIGAPVSSVVVVTGFALSDMALLGATWYGVQKAPWLLGALLRTSALLLANGLFLASQGGTMLLVAALFGELAGLGDSADALAKVGASVVGRVLTTPVHRRSITALVLAARLLPPPVAVLASVTSSFEDAAGWLIGGAFLTRVAIWVHDVVWAVVPPTVVPPATPAHEDFTKRAVRVGGGRTWSSDDRTFTHYHIHLADQEGVSQSSPQVGAPLRYEDLSEVLHQNDQEWHPNEPPFEAHKHSGAARQAGVPAGRVS